MRRPRNSELFGRLYSVLLVTNIIGIILLLTLILINLYRLAVQFRTRVMGSRLTLRLFGMFVLLAVIPVSVVLFFSLQAVNKGIDSWFDVNTEKALDDALLLGRTALDAIRQDPSESWPGKRRWNLKTHRLSWCCRRWISYARSTTWPS